VVVWQLDLMLMFTSIAYMRTEIYPLDMTVAQCLFHFECDYVPVLLVNVGAWECWKKCVAQHHALLCANRWECYVECVMNEFCVCTRL